MPERGEVWQVDFGAVAKVRPALIISVPYADADRALIGVIPHTTATRGSQFEVSVQARFLAEGLPIATGVIEGACRYLIQDRLGITGARWGLTDAEAVLKLRAIRTSGDWDAYWRFHLKNEHARNHPLAKADALPLARGN